MSQNQMTISAAAAVMFIVGGVVADDMRNTFAPFLENRDWAKFIILFVVLFYFTRSAVQSFSLTAILFVMRFVSKTTCPPIPPECENPEQ